MLVSFCFDSYFWVFWVTLFVGICLVLNYICSHVLKFNMDLFKSVSNKVFVFTRSLTRMDDLNNNNNNNK